MSRANSGASRAFYFALPRLLSKMHERRPGFSENNPLEAYFGSFVVFAISYLLGAQFFLRGHSGWSTFAICALLLFAVWVFWIFALCIGSLVIKALQTFGLLQKTPVRYLQDVFVWTLIAIFAGRLAVTHSPLRCAGMACLALIGLNVAAAMLLVFTHECGTKKRPAPLRSG
jgi:hypothetical protein